MSKMIDFRESTVKYAKAQDCPIYNQQWRLLASIVSCLASSKLHLASFKPIDNRWVWGKYVVKWKGGQLSEPWRYQCIHDNPTQTSLQMLE